MSKEKRGGKQLYDEGQQYGGEENLGSSSTTKQSTMAAAAANDPNLSLGQWPT